MSGNGSSGGGGGSGGHDDTPDCAALIATASINSPVREEVAKLSEGDELAVELDRSGPVPFLILKAPSGNRVGSINPSNVRRLLSCIQSGYGYSATVVRAPSSPTDGRVDLTIRCNKTPE